MEIEPFLIQFQDHLAPRLDTYEQAIYLYVLRHTRLIGKDEAVIGFKSERRRMARGIGEKGRRMSEGTAYSKLQSSESKGCITIVASERMGRRIRPNLPDEIPGVIPEPTSETPPSAEDLDFFAVPEHRVAILEREDHRCFYCLRVVNGHNHVIEHVVSRPERAPATEPIYVRCLMRLLMVASLMLLLVGCGPPSRSEFQRLEAQGDPVVRQIEQYQADHGDYPSDLAGAGITLPEAGYGGWQYRVFDNGEKFELSIGDYGKHGFVLFWDGDSWYRDT